MDILTLILAAKLGKGGSGGALPGGLLNQIMVMGQTGLYWEDPADSEDLTALLVRHQVLPAFIDADGAVLIDADNAILI